MSVLGMCVRRYIYDGHNNCIGIKLTVNCIIFCIVAALNVSFMLKKVHHRILSTYILVLVHEIQEISFVLSKERSKLVVNCNADNGN